MKKVVKVLLALVLSIASLETFAVGEKTIIKGHRVWTSSTGLDGQCVDEIICTQPYNETCMEITPCPPCPTCPSGPIYANTSFNGLEGTTYVNTSGGFTVEFPDNGTVINGEAVKFEIDEAKERVIVTLWKFNPKP